VHARQPPAIKVGAQGNALVAESPTTSLLACCWWDQQFLKLQEVQNANDSWTMFRHRIWLVQWQAELLQPEVNLNNPQSSSLADKINEWLQQNSHVFVTDVTYMIQGASRIAYITWRKLSSN
jgi:hypothetical protein